MVSSNSLTVLNASAGSGKTYSLVKAYITTLLISENSNKYRQLLAITFTNKAVQEMKERILETLYAFSVYKDQDAIPEMMTSISKEIEESPITIAKKASHILNAILHNYAAFDVVTIDTLTHRILRTFSKDLEISGNFEVSLDTKTLQARAVDALIDSAGQDERITNILVEFALQKADDDKSWDITRDLNEIAQLLSSENDAPYVAQLQSKTLDDFDALKKELHQFEISLKAGIEHSAKTHIELIHSLGLDENHFSGKYFYNHLVKLQENPLEVDYKAKWKQDIDNYTFYKKAEKQPIKDDIDSIREQLIICFKETKNLYYKLQLVIAFTKKVVPLSVLQLIHKELQKIKEDENILLISDFNALIYKSLREQPAAFIYERLGERYANYFIDEFQDTSVVQWHNLIPLVDSAITTETRDAVKNSLLLVGDPKQAIYRWRGGKAEQFIDLSNEIHPFSIESTSVQQLDTNYRSYSEIIHFNNRFFTYISSFFKDPTYTSIYKTDNNQAFNHRKGGLVSLQFIEAETAQDADEIYPAEVLKIIHEVVDQGFLKSDICILTRSNKHGAHIAQYLAANQIKVVSSESLLIHSAPSVRFVHAILELQLQPNTPQITLKLLSFLANRFQIEDTHDFYNQWAKTPTADFLKSLEERHIYYSPSLFESLSLYEGVEYMIRAFHLEKEADAYLFGYLNAIFEYTQRNNGGLIGFLNYWEEKKDTLSIVAPPQSDAIQIMSVHKSKGLEFDIVIYPYADSELYTHRNEHHWYPTNASDFAGFEHLLIGHKTDVSSYSSHGAVLYDERISQQQFDAVNILYVALTRAIERVYVLSRFRESALKTNTISDPKTFSDLFIAHLHQEGIWEGPEKPYIYGEASIKVQNDIEDTKKVVTIPFLSSSKESHNIRTITKAGFLWNEERQNAIAYGNLIHELMAKIIDRQDIEDAVTEAVYEGMITEDEKNAVKAVLSSVVNHPELQPYFSRANTVYNERKILSADGTIHIPDRIEVLPDGSAIIMDYKTGIPLENHAYQIQQYAQLLKEMDIVVKQLFLLYINKEVTIIKV
ncbi:ATP-dependent helicase [Dokdonia pacifica]|uniref:DNA 3'-5' helicase n=1 Tax=Dokdonia pacifica TaxID=1627892 RepID=A0A238WBM5_9FLAO|nr:UvrD-helicase domain-containing protein [Dokdonia pacifica]GGG13201.1 ATP-dependent helicase [Dokdonia pacifica]SNR43985.1 ATP-dependent exoDNAse (exonuclease V) beta subunit (contains helicase and exonuclease domains) [Dokdonia pacifica]